MLKISQHVAKLWARL